MWEKVETGGIAYYTLPKWKELGAEVYISTRKGGVSVDGYDSLNLARHVGDEDAAVTENRRRFLQAIDVPEENFVSIQQTHSTNVRLVTTEDKGRGLASYEDAIADTDGIYTRETGLCMATFYADCLPLAFFDPVHKVLGLAHAGWRGTYGNIGKVLLDEMKMTFGSCPEEVLFATGPGIGFCCYEVDKDFYEGFIEKYQEAVYWFSASGEGKYYFDNRIANAMLMGKEGIQREHMDFMSSCSCCNQRTFYSFRGSGGKCGRHGLFGYLR